MTEHLQNDIQQIASGDTSVAERFFCRPGGRRYLENVSMILLNTLLPHVHDKEAMYVGFTEVLDRMEHRIHRQQEGGKMLDDVLYPRL